MVFSTKQKKIYLCYQDGNVNMNWFINDLSFSGQYSTNDEFIDFLQKLLKLRNDNAVIKSNLYCSRILPQLKVVRNNTLRDVVNASKNKLIKGQLLEWLNKKGPFWDDDRQTISDDDFELFDTVITDQGAAEAARQTILGKNASLFSLENASPCCSHTPLKIMQILDDLSQVPHDITNHWKLSQLIEHSDTLNIEAVNWPQLIEQVAEQYSHLIISDTILKSLLSQPFSPIISRRVSVLLSILNQLIGSRNENGEYTPATHAIFEKHFAGDRPLFTDESVSNKRTFKKQLTFSDSHNQNIFCSWHGKISHRSFRLHFEFPLPATKKRMEISYIGCKLTK